LANQGPGVGKRILNFFTESWQELKKVSWPSKAEVKNFTLVVIATVAFVGLCLYVFDTILGLLMNRLLGQ
jgi:preprotein translocase subunit SecE